MGRRRGHGEGSIYQRESDGLWCTSVDLGIVNGKRKRKVIYGKTRKEVADKLKALHRDQQLGLKLATEVVTVKHYLERWLEQVVKVRNRPRTHKSYDDTVRLYITPHIGQLQLAKLQPEHVQTMLNRLSEAGLSPRTVQYTRAILRKALNQALKWGYVVRNVATLVETPPVKAFAIAPLSLAQAQRFLSAVRGHRLEVLYQVALSLGLRRGEVLGLRWSDVNLDQRTLRITVALQRQGGALVLSEPKTRSSTRVLPLPEVLVQALRRHQQLQERERAELGEAWVAHGMVFPAESGTPLEPRNLIRHFKSVLKAAELPDATRFHDLRHSCATFLIAQGVHPRVVMEILGHSQISVTMNTYGHVVPADQHAAIAGVAGLFTSTQGDGSPEQAHDPPSENPPSAK
jgi:integrase